jgi:hypothetical protein
MLMIVHTKKLLAKEHFDVMKIWASMWSPDNKVCKG